VTRAREAVAGAKAARATTVLTTEVSPLEVTTARDSTTLCVKDAEDHVALVEREAL
jgi:hypothetical protein